MRRKAARVRSQKRITNTDKCSKSEIGSDADSGGLNDVKCIVNELLMYT